MSQTVPNPPSARGRFRWLLGLMFILSLLLNISLIWWIWPVDESETARPSERFHSCQPKAKDKIAIVRIEGTIIEGFVGFMSQQVRAAAQDPEVKAVVLVINSPGGTVTASDQLWKQIKDLHEGKWERQSFAKPIVVAMESIAASGGYYVAAPADKIYAQPTTVTGSIGVFATFFDLHQLAEKHGIAVNILKKGELKGSSMFMAMRPEERQEWDQLLEAAYQRFMKLVLEGRDSQKYGKRLKHGLRDEFKLRSSDGADFVRRLADGGIFMAEQAQELGLVDHIGYLEDAVKEAKTLAGLTEARVISYNRPVSLVASLLGISTRQPEPLVNLDDIPGATGRLWFLTPGHELAGVRLPVEWLHHRD